MRALKSILIYHPNGREGALLRYAMEITLRVHAHLAKTSSENPDPEIEVTVRWTRKVIEIRNLKANTYRTLPLKSTNLDLMEGMRNGLARRGYSRRGVHKEREEKQAAVLVTRVKQVVKEICRVERMMTLACPVRKRRAA